MPTAVLFSRDSIKILNVRLRRDVGVLRKNDMAGTGKRAYEQDVARRPNYHDGTPRKTWDQLGDVAQWSWSRVFKGQQR